MVRPNRRLDDEGPRAALTPQASGAAFGGAEEAVVAHGLIVETARRSCIGHSGPEFDLQGSGYRGRPDSGPEWPTHERSAVSQ